MKTNINKRKREANSNKSLIHLDRLIVKCIYIRCCFLEKKRIREREKECDRHHKYTLTSRDNKNDD